MINENWSKWIQRDILKHFTNNLPADYNVISETADVDKNAFDKWCEVRVDIIYRHLQKNTYYAHVNVDILVVSTKQKNIYNCKIMTGKVAAQFDNISVIDSGVTKFCLRVDGPVIDTYYGELETQANMEQATVEGAFEALIVET